MDQGQRVFWVVCGNSTTKFSPAGCKDWDDVARAAHDALGLTEPAASLSLRLSSSRTPLRPADPVPADFVASPTDPLVVSKRVLCVVGAGSLVTRLPSLDLSAFRERALHGGPWTAMRQQGGVVVSLMHGISKATARVAAPPQVVRDACVLGPERSRWDRFVVSIDVLRDVAADEMSCEPGRQGVASGAVHVVLANIKCSNLLTPWRRDFAVATAERREQDGGFTILTKSCETMEIREQPGFTRGYLVESGFIVDPVEGDPNSSQVTFVTHVNLGGWFLQYLTENWVCPDWPWQLFYLVKQYAPKEEPRPAAAAAPASGTQPQAQTASSAPAEQKAVKLDANAPLMANEGVKLVDDAHPPAPLPDLPKNAFAALLATPPPAPALEQISALLPAQN